MNEIALALDIRALAPGIACGTWLPVALGTEPDAPELDHCAVCGRSYDEHDHTDDDDVDD